MDNNIIPAELCASLWVISKSHISWKMKMNCCRCCRDRQRDVSMNHLSSYSWRINRSWWSPGG